MKTLIDYRVYLLSEPSCAGVIQEVANGVFGMQYRVLRTEGPAGSRVTGLVDSNKVALVKSEG